jgi:ubiquitin carboxyl-terminal hydrolase L3
MSAAGSDDRLKALNDELRGQANAQGPWLPLESNPEVFSSFAKKVGLPETHEWQDILGLDPDLLAMVPQPVAAIILLFPCTPGIYRARREEDRSLQAHVAAGSLTEAASKPFFLEQVASFGNACGTIAAVHSLTNADIPRLQSGPVCAFRDKTAAKTPTQRGAALLTTQHLKEVSDTAAEHVAAQTTCPSREGPDLDHHYCAFVPVKVESGAVHVVELDGTKVCPVDHGPVAGGDTFLQGAAAVVQASFMSVEPGSMEFAMMALCTVG